MLIEGEGTLIHSLVYPNLIRNWKKEHSASTYPGDFIVTNDPYSEAAHLPDIYCWYPIFVGDEIAAWSVAGGHLPDVGGSTPGSCACDSTEIYQEGLRIPPMKLYERGVPNDTLFKLLRAASRTPDMLIGDIEAYRTACQIGEQRFLELVERNGWESLKVYLDYLLEYAEELMRAEIKAMPDGEYEFTDFMDDDGINRDTLLRFHLKVTVKGDEIIYDWTGTSPQVKGAINMPSASLRAIHITALRNMTDPEIPRNSGTFRPVKIIVPERNILNPSMPAAVAGRGVTFSRLCDVLLGAEAQIHPEKMPACCAGNDTLIMMGGYDENGKAFVLGETNWGGWGGRPFADGVDFSTPAFSNASNQPCETNEELYPLFMYDQYALVTDTEGAGKYRGTLSVARDWRYIGETDVVFQLRTDRQKISPYGLFGGEPGAVAESVLNPDTNPQRLRKQTLTLKKNDVYRLLTQGGGGWGDVLERAAKEVQEDVRNEKVGLRRAREVYGVVMDEKTLEVDLEATRKLREAMKKRKGDPLERDVKMVQDDVRNQRVSLRRAREVYGVVTDEKTLEVDMEETQKIRGALKEQRGVPATALTVPLGSSH